MNRYAAAAVGDLALVRNRCNRTGLRRSPGEFRRTVSPRRELDLETVDVGFECQPEAVFRRHGPGSVDNRSQLRQRVRDVLEQTVVAELKRTDRQDFEMFSNNDDVLRGEAGLQQDSGGLVLELETERFRCLRDEE